MGNKSFVHLYTYGILTPGWSLCTKEVVAKAAEFGMPALP